MVSTFKRLLAITAMICLFASTVVFAAYDQYIHRLEVNDTPFDPSNGESTDIEFELLRSGRVNVYIIDSSRSKVATLADTNYELPIVPLSYTWHGTVNNTPGGTPLPDGDYAVHVLIYDDYQTPGVYQQADFQAEPITIGTVAPVDPPEITNFNINPDPFDPNTETTAVQFDVDQDANITMTARNSSGVLVGTFSQYDGDAYPAYYAHDYDWDGRHYSTNQILPDGDYTFEVTATNANGSDTATHTVEIDAVTTPQNPPQITKLTASPDPFDSDSETTMISFDVDQDAYITLEIENSSGNVVKTYSSYDGDFHLATSSDFDVYWDGENNSGQDLADGNYTIRLRVQNSNGVDSDYETVEIDTGSSASAPRITGLDVDPQSFDPDQEDTTIEFDVDQGAYITVEIKDGSQVVDTFSQYDHDYYSSAYNHDFDWDGGNLSDGTYTVEVYATNSNGSDTETHTVTIDGDNITNFYLDPNDHWDPDDESLHIHFCLEEDSDDLEVRARKGSRTLDIYKNSYPTDRCYNIYWDGEEDGTNEEVTNGDWQIIVETDDPDDTESKYIDVDFGGGGSNDVIDNLTLDPSNNWDPDEEDLEIEFDLEEDVSDLTVEATKSGETILIKDFNSEDKRDNIRVYWDGEDEFGREVEEGRWTIRVESDNPDDDESRTIYVDYDGNRGSGDCGGYEDTDHLNGELCDAIEWVTDEGIFHGYSDGYFRPYNNINRAEVLKTVLEAFDVYGLVTMLPADGSNLGFRDVDPDAWYMTYARTGKFYGMLHGYLNSTEARFGNYINRVEYLKFALEASDAFTDYEVKGYERSYYSDVDEDNPKVDWFMDYAGACHEFGLFDSYGSELRPGDYVTRGEVALVLYRMDRHGLLN